MSVHLSIFLFVYLSVSHSVWLTVYLLIPQIQCPSVYLSVCLSLCLKFLIVIIFCLFVFLLFCISVYLSVYLSVSLTVSNYRSWFSFVYLLGVFLMQEVLGRDCKHKISIFILFWFVFYCFVIVPFFYIFWFFCNNIFVGRKWESWIGCIFEWTYRIYSRKSWSAYKLNCHCCS